MQEFVNVLTNPIVWMLACVSFAMVGLALTVYGKGQIASFVRRNVCKHTLASDLPTGLYTVTSSSQKTVTIGYLVYDWESEVYGNNKSWTVVSARPLPDNFSMDNGEMKKVA